MALTTVRSTGISSLPSISGANLTSLNASNISSGTLSTSRYVQGGITSASQYRLTTDTTNSGLSSNIIVNNWELNDTSGYASLGSPVTQSSGIFTFPSTGIWLVKAIFAFYEDTGGTDTVDVYMYGTRNNFSNTNDQMENFTTIFDGYSNASVTGEHLYDVSDTSNHKMKFGVTGLLEGNYLRGNTNKNSTSVTFIRLGDT